MAHRQHQVHLPALREVDANLKIRFAGATQQVGPVSQIRTGFEAERQNLLQGRQQFPYGFRRRIAGHLNAGTELVADAGESWKTIQLLLKRTRAEDKNSQIATQPGLWPIV